jgi:trimeric autotransporter adhesin
MSTKTTFKRVALVAVAALGLGVLSVAPSSATVSSLTVTTANGTATRDLNYDSTTAATFTVSALLDTLTDTVTVTYVSKSVPTGADANAGRLRLIETSTVYNTIVDTNTAAISATSVSPLLDSVVAGTSVNTFRIRTAAAGYASAGFRLELDSATARTAGTYTYSVIVKTFSAGSALAAATTTYDVSIVVAELATASRTASAAQSTAVLSTGIADAGSTQDSVVAVLATASATARAVIRVNLKNVAGGNAQESLTAVVTGPGTIGVSGGSFGKNVTVAASAGVNTFEIRSDGTAGTASIVISTPSVTFAAKSVTFYAATPTTAVAAANKPVIAVSTNTSVVAATIKDANGNNWAGTAYIWAASAADALIAGSETAAACTYTASISTHLCDVTGKTAGTANFIVGSSDSKTAATTIKSNSVAVRVSTGIPTTVKLAFDKATYAPGEKAQVWITALDAAGLPLPAQTITNFFGAGGISSSTALGTGSDTLTSTTIALEGATSATSGTVAGYEVHTVYMPFASGDITISATGGTGIAPAGRVAVSATASVVNSSVDAATDAANEATDAANAATDAALAAADAADAATAAAQDASDAVAALSASVSKLISSLRAQITSLTNLVIKIQKKVRA